MSSYLACIVHEERRVMLPFFMICSIRSITGVVLDRKSGNFEYTNLTGIFIIKRSTVNVVIFTGGKFRENVGKTFHVGVIFSIQLLFLS